MIDADIRHALLALGRRALEASVLGEPLPRVPAELDRPTNGVFVTLHCRGDLRGCLGTLDDDARLGPAVMRLAADVPREDHRFAPIAPHELPHVVIDLSILTPPEIVDDPAAIELGRDGLIVESGRRRGLLLPQVPIEHGWDRETFLAQTCVKAGLQPDAWRRGATLLRFQAEVFGEGDPTGAP